MGVHSPLFVRGTRAMNQARQVLINMETRGTAIFGMGLTCEDVAEVQARTELRIPISCGREHDARVLRLRMKRVNEVERHAVGQSIEQRPFPRRAGALGRVAQTVPADLRNLDSAADTQS